MGFGVDEIVCFYDYGLVFWWSFLIFVFIYLASTETTERNTQSFNDKITFFFQFHCGFSHAATFLSTGLYTLFMFTFSTFFISDQINI